VRIDCELFQCQWGTKKSENKNTKKSERQKHKKNQKDKNQKKSENQKPKKNQKTKNHKKSEMKKTTKIRILDCCIQAPPCEGTYHYKRLQQ